MIDAYQKCPHDKNTQVKYIVGQLMVVCGNPWRMVGLIYQQ